MIKIQTLMLRELKKIPKPKLKPIPLRQTKQNKQNLNPCLTNLLKELSLSFYGEDTIRKNKQIIYDNYDTTEELALLSALFSSQKSRESKPKQQGPKLMKREIELKIDNLFQDQKQYEFQLVTTNASQGNCKSREQSAAKKNPRSRPSSVKTKDSRHDDKAFRQLLNDTLSGRCKTLKVCSKKDELYRLKKK